MAGALNPQQITRPGRAYLYLAKVGTLAPTTVDSEPPAPWRNVGLFTEDSLTFSTSPEFQDVRSAQSDFATRTFQTTDGATLAVQLQQWNGDNFKAVYGGGSVEAVGGSTGLYKFAPPSLGSRDETAAIIKVVDGSDIYLFVFPRTQQTEGVELGLQKGQEARLALSLRVVGGDGVDPWYCLTNSDAFAPVAVTP
jgi:hypothetical protein